MGWIDKLRGKKILIDTAPLIYFIEENPNYIGIIDNILNEVSKGSIELLTSPITLMEVLVKPLREGDLLLFNEYRRILVNSKDLKIIPIDHEIAIKTA